MNTSEIWLAASMAVLALVTPLVFLSIQRTEHKRMELMATLAGEPLYCACGCEPVESLTDDRGRVPVPLVRMGKTL